MRTRKVRKGEARKQGSKALSGEKVKREGKEERQSDREEMDTQTSMKAHKASKQAGKQAGSRQQAGKQAQGQMDKRPAQTRPERKKNLPDYCLGFGLPFSVVSWVLGRGCYQRGHLHERPLPTPSACPPAYF